MRKFLLLALLIALSQICKAQEESKPRNIIVGGSLNFLAQNNSYPLGLSTFNLGAGTYSSITRDNKYIQFGFSSYVGRKVSEKWILGGQINYNLFTSKYTVIEFLNPSSSIKNKSIEHKYGIGIFGRYNLNPQNRLNFYLFPYANFSYLNNDLNSNSISIQQTKGKYVDMGIDCGILYNLNDGFRLTARMGGINYINGNFKTENIDSPNISQNFNSLGLNFSFARIQLGAEMIL